MFILAKNVRLVKPFKCSILILEFLLFRLTVVLLGMLYDFIALSFIYKCLSHLYLLPRSLIWILKGIFSVSKSTFTWKYCRRVKYGMLKMNPYSPHHLFNLLSFFSQQMASSSIIHVRNLEVNRNSTPSLKSHSITKSCWVYHHTYIKNLFMVPFNYPSSHFL